MVTKELIEKAKKCATKEELLKLAKLEEIDLSDEAANTLIASFKSNNGELSDQELDNVAGGTCYGNGWDGIYRPIVTDTNNCKFFTVVYIGNDSWSRICPNCTYYSKNNEKNSKGISVFSGWCTHSDRIKGKDLVNQ